MLTAEQIEVTDMYEALELFYREKWTDGLPVVPPTEAKVEEMVHYLQRDPNEIIGIIPPKGGVATVEALAINTVMGGCLPEYFPIVVATVKAMLETKHALHGNQVTTHGSEPLIIVNGPIRKRLGMSSQYAVFGGGGSRANGTIGRAIRLILWNLGGCYPGEPDMTNFSHPGRWSYCIAEDEEGSPWVPFHADRGFPREIDAVTCFACDAPISVISSQGKSERILNSIVSALYPIGGNNRQHLGELLIALTSTNAQQFANDGWSKDDIRKEVWERSRIPLKVIKEGLSAIAIESRLWPDWVERYNDDFLLPITAKWEDIHIVVCGGGSYFSAVCPGWGALGGLAVTKQIEK